MLIVASLEADPKGQKRRSKLTGALGICPGHLCDVGLGF